MLETKYIPQENANRIVNILKKAQEINKLVKFKVIDDERGGVLYYGDNPEKAVHEMDGVNFNFGVNCVEDLGYDHDNKVVGWFFFTPYEDLDSVLCNHTANNFCHQCIYADEEEQIEKQVKIMHRYDSIAEKYTTAFNKSYLTLEELYDVLTDLIAQRDKDLNTGEITYWTRYYSGEENW